MPNSASTVPPFIPGLLIVSLLIIISIIIGWRNYSQRGNPRLMPGMGVWAVWEVDGDGGMEGGTNRSEKPKMWEVDIVWRPTGEKDTWNDGWDKIMPLSATSLTSGPPTVGPSLDPETLRNHVTPNTSSRVSLRDVQAHKPPMPSSLPSTPLAAATDRLQISVLISMPSPSKRMRHSPMPLTSALPECLPESPPRESTSSSLWKEKSNWIHSTEEQEEELEGSPEMALGVTVLPWQKDDGVMT